MFESFIAAILFSLFAFSHPSNEISGGWTQSLNLG
jgi:hypothetical protein